MAKQSSQIVREQANRGRPKSSKSKPVEHAEAKPSSCPQCGSSQREPYFNRTEQAVSGEDAAGQHYTHIVYRRTACAACGQHRIDRRTENRARK